jgi:pyridoxal phosphate enzyme (YggS family)
MIAERIREMKEQLPVEVVLVAVSKTKPLGDIKEAYEAGQRVFGENRVQEMQEKAEQLPDDIQWHMIGHVQSNKIKYFAPFVSMVHGMDKPKRFKELNKEAAKNQRVIDCLIQIHIAKEESKFGFDYDEAEAFLQADIEEKYPNLRIRGLMGMATFTDNQTQVKAEFDGLKQFFDKIKGKQLLADFNVLSMGMSGDYEIAIDAGSTMVRIGSALFGARN